MFIIKYKKIFFTLSALLVAFSLFSIFYWGLNPGIEFTGGALSEISYEETRPEIQDIEGVLTSLSLGTTLIQPTGETGYIIRSQNLTADHRDEFFEALSFGGEKVVNEERFNLIGPSIGEELTKKAFVAIILVVIGIILFIAFSFRGIGKTVSGKEKEVGITAWHYGSVAVVALVHDILIPTGIFAFLGSVFVNAEIDVLFVTALLAILGYSVNDTIVVFDRVRENLRDNQETKTLETFAETVGRSLRQTYARSINTSLTTLIVLSSLFFVGGAVTHNFVLVLAIGVLVGTYSSLFLAAPLLVAASQKRGNQ